MNQYSKKSRTRLDSADPRLRQIFEALLPHFDHTILYGERSKAKQDSAVARGKSKAPWPTSNHNNPCANCDGSGEVGTGDGGLLECPDCIEGEAELQEDKRFPAGARAVDAIPYPLDWNDYARIRYFAGWVMATAASLGIKIRWGGDWDNDTEVKDQRFNDLVHFELIE